jgi:hypothetical protein
MGGARACELTKRRRRRISKPSLARTPRERRAFAPTRLDPSLEAPAERGVYGELGMKSVERGATR